MQTEHAHAADFGGFGGSDVLGSNRPVQTELVIRPASLLTVAAVRRTDLLVSCGRARGNVGRHALLG